MKSLTNIKPRKRRKYKTDDYKGWKIRYIIPREGDAHKSPYWITDNCDRNDRQRQAFKTKLDAIEHIDKEATEAESYGVTFHIDDDVRIAALKAIKMANGRATLSDIVKFWAERHPDDGGKLSISKMGERFMAFRAKQGIRPATVRAIRQKLSVFAKKMGEDAPIAGVRDEEVVRFVESRTGGDESRRAWKKVLNAFFRFCQSKAGGEVIKTNPAAQIVLPKKPKKTPSVWSVSEVQAVLRQAERDEPGIAAGLAMLFLAGLRPTELVGQYGLEDARITTAKKELAQARTNFDAEKIRLGLDRGQGGDTAKQAGDRVKLESSEQATALRAALAKLAEARKRYEGKPMPGLQWQDIHLDDPEDMFIHVRAETSKVQEARNVEILPNLVSWLEKYRKVAGAVVPNPTAFRRARRRILVKMHVKHWTADVPRHCFASYHYKKYGNRDKLAEMLGHTDMSKEIERHYKKTTVSKADAEKYWKIMPDGVPLAVAGVCVVRARGA